MPASPSKIVGDCHDCKKLVDGLKLKVSGCQTLEEKYHLLTCLPGNVTIAQIRSDFGVGKTIATRASKLRSSEGPFSAPYFNKRGPKPDDELTNIIRRFYLDDSNSRPSPRANDTIIVTTAEGKKRVAKILILNNLKDFFEEFKVVNKEFLATRPRLGISKFAALRPKQCRWPEHRIS
ncbi:hypothetical protein Fcan01_27326 [Folsomia candida]|uniref:Uncharacterized protein n=1 Tax=Folsomia candida TaxID=158441 RepID=A0A226CWZ9_FOLCA|nr:hypothetical protein Fcan01_27326 [Folsomia candida]